MILHRACGHDVVAIPMRVAGLIRVPFMHLLSTSQVRVPSLGLRLLPRSSYKRRLMAAVHLSACGWAGRGGGGEGRCTCMHVCVCTPGVTHATLADVQLSMLMACMMHCTACAAWSAIQMLAWQPSLHAPVEERLDSTDILTPGFAVHAIVQSPTAQPCCRRHRAM